MAWAVAGAVVDVFVAPESAFAVGAEDHAAIRPAAQHGQHVLFGQQRARVDAGDHAVAHVNTLWFAPVDPVISRPGNQQRLVEVFAAVHVDVAMDAGAHEHGHNVIENSSSHMADYLAHNLLDSPQQEVEPAFAVPPVELSPEVEVEAVEEETPKRKRRSLKGSSNLYCRIDQRTHLDLKLYALMEERSMSEIVNEALQSHVPKMNAPYQRTTA